MDRTYLDWPFFAPEHRDLARQLDAWAPHNFEGLSHGSSNEAVDADCRELVKRLAAGGFTRYAVPGAYGGALAALDSRSLCLIREHLAYHEGLADFAFAMQGLGSGAIALAGSEALKQAYLPKVAKGEAIAAFALSEPEAGSDVGAMAMSARRDGDHYVLNGSKTWISAFVVDATAPGFSIAGRIEVIAPHPLATLRFDNARIPASHLLGEEHQGFKLAMQTLDIFRSSVAAAALGFARRALDEALARAKSRRMFGATLGDLQLTQATIGEMATLIDSAALLTYRAAWQRDVLGERATREAAMAKMTATENAQVVIDRAVQMFGGAGVKSGEMVEKLYREIRALRIYEGATEVQKLIIARETMKH
jgi:acyl-CoA dehydrogenase